MEIVYYFDNDLNLCPVKKYIEDYLPITSGRNLAIITNIDEKIRHIQENPCKPAGFISKLHGYNSIEIKHRKDKDIVIRILYFIHGRKIVLLNAFEKPDNYKKRIEKELDKYYLLADIYIEKFKKTPNFYEEYK